ncbi:MAG TPA: pyruvate kinase [Candidatus Saccharimonadales bacterium]|nr:pyruvate kinase [Candidatus Saccharimonadales bacterium]
MSLTEKAPQVSSRAFKRTKIVASIGPATHSYEMILGIMKAGVNVFRFNFSHGIHDERNEQIKWIRKASAELDKPVAIILDLQGPKIRCGGFVAEMLIKKGDVLHFKYGAEFDEDAKIIPIEYDLSEKVKVGERIFLVDGKFKGKVAKVSKGVIDVEMENEGLFVQRAKQHKAFNVPDTSFGGDILTKKDLQDIAYGADKDFDYVAISFVQTPEDMHHLRHLLDKHGYSPDIKIMSKIETPAAVQDGVLEEIVKASDAVMVARGDLAVEVSPEAVPIVQRKILAFCQKHAKISIVATQMLISMVDNPTPTRPEVSDIANAVITGADSVMLSEETTVGEYPVEVVKTMKRVILYTQENVAVRPIYEFPESDALQDAISDVVMALAHEINAAAIVVETKSGKTARMVASRRPHMPIVAVTSNQRVCQELALLYGTMAFVRPDGVSAGLDLAMWLKEKEVFKKGDRVVIVSGKQPGLIGGTDTIKVRVLE